MSCVEKPIAVGDLVQVVRPMPCCGNTCAIGWHRTVLAFGYGKRKCKACGHIYETRTVVLKDGDCLPERLKRISPLFELESTKTDEPMKEPA